MNARSMHARLSAVNGRLRTVTATFEALEDRRLMTTTIPSSIVQSAALTAKIPPPIVTPLAPTGQQQNQGGTAVTTTATAAAKPEFYSQGVLKFLVKNGYLTQVEANRSGGRRTVVDGLVQVKRDAASLGASDAALKAALELVLKGRTKDAQRTVVADGLGLPAEALKSNLTSKQLAKYVENLQLLGQGDRAKDPKHWTDVITRGTEATLKDAVGDALGMPPDALKSKLSAKGLLEHVGDLQVIGATDQVTDPAYWQKVVTKGTDAALADAVRDVLDIPEAAAVGKKAKDLLQGAAEIQELGADARSAKAWQGLDKLKKGQIKLEQFTKDYADGKDVDQQASDQANNAADNAQNAAQNAANEAAQGFNAVDPAVHNAQPAAGAAAQNGAASNVANGSQSSSQQGAGTAVDPIIAAFAGFGPNGEDGGQDGGVADAVVVVHNNADGSYTTTTYELGADGNPEVVATETFTDADGDGVYEGDHGGSGDKPADGAYPATRNEDGGYSYSSGNDQEDGDGKNGDGSDGDDDDDDDDDDNDDNDDNENGDANAAAPADSSGGDEGSNSPEVSNSSTPTPDADVTNPAARLNYLLTTPMGRAELKAIGEQLGLRQGGGYTDPAEDGVDLFSAAVFYSSKLGRANAPGLKTTGGAVDYPDDVQQGPTFDKHQILAIQLAAGGTLVDPDHYVQPTVQPGRNNPVIPPVGFTGGGGTRRGANTTGGTAAATTGVFSAVRISTAPQAIPTSAVQSASLKVSATASIAKVVVK